MNVKSPASEVGRAAGVAEDVGSYFELNGPEYCSMPPFASGFDYLVILMAGKSYFGATTTNCWSFVAAVPWVEKEEEVAAADATNCSGSISAASSVLAAATASVRCAVIASAINVVTFNYFISDFDSVNLKI